MGWNDNARVTIAHGARAAEIELIDAVLESTQFDPECGFGQAPVRVIVPSRSLREHVSSRFVARTGGGLAGLTVQTLHAVVSTILEAVRSRGLETGRQSPALFGVLVRQLARREPALRASLDDLRDGYASVEAAVSDLLDAGFEPTHADAVIEQLQESPGGPTSAGMSASKAARERESEWEGSWQRACALVRVAAGANRAASGIGHESVEIALARQWLESDPERFLPSSAIFVFGFADVTGVQADLIEALVRRCGARVTIDVPRDPAERGRIDSGVAFTQRFTDRIKAASGQSDAPPAFDPLTDSVRRAAACVLHAPGRAAEVRAVALRVRGLLDEGECAEGIAVVARTLDGYRAALRTHFHRLAIPFSGVGERGDATAVTRRHSALLALLRDGPRAPVDRWIDALQGLARGNRLSMRDRADLASAFHSLGIGRLGQVTDWDDVLRGSSATDLPADTSSTDTSSTDTSSTEKDASNGEQKYLSLPVRGGLREPREDRPPVAVRCVLSIDRIAAAAAAARALLDHQAGWPRRTSLSVHLRTLRVLVRRDLRWRTGDPAFDELERAVFGVFASESGAFVFDRDDFVRLVERCLAKSSIEPIGGNGGGVAVLSATEARSRTFEHLFVIGLSRDVFPRPISQDPLLPDGLRRRLRVVLPDMPVKREGADEERYLFAQLLSSSPDVVLSCPITDENGKPIPVSPLLERLRGVTPIVAPGLLQAGEPVHSQPSDQSQQARQFKQPQPQGYAALRPAHEHALIAGLYGTRNQFRRAFRIAVAETGGASREMLGHTASLADSRVAVLSELQGLEPISQAPRLGPYFGFVGPATEKADPRRAPLFITAAEQIAACPWQAFIRLLLRVEPVPDACAELPSADPRLVGALVHDVLQRLAGDALLRAGADPEIEDLSALAAQSPVGVHWPAAKDEMELLLRRADTLAAAHGIRTPGFSRVLAARAQGHLPAARQSLCSSSPAGSAGVIGVEVSGVVRMRNDDREVRFRADRVDRSIEHKLALIDYKTGKPFATQKSDDARRAALRKRMARGESLQAGAYAIAAAQASGEVGIGQYLYLDPNAPDYSRSVSIRSDATDLIETFERSIATVFEVIERGSFFPRLVDAATGTEPRRCSNCEVKEACIRGDTGSRQRLERWVSDAHPVSPEEVALVDMWKIGESEP